jgi:hypothetical protein
MKNNNALVGVLEYKLENLQSSSLFGNIVTGKIDLPHYLTLLHWQYSCHCLV